MHGSPASHRCMGTVQVILVGALLGAALRAILCSAIEHRDAAWCGHLRALPSAPAELPEGRSESLRHQAVDDGVDGTVQVDAHPAEEEEPNVEVRGGSSKDFTTTSVRYGSHRRAKRTTTTASILVTW